MLEGDNDPPPRKTPWELYNDRAALYDREMLKEWDDNLSTLLLFATLFSGVSSTFIIGSMTYLTPDNQGAIVHMLQQISLQLANNTIPAYHSIIYEAPSWATTVNFLFFASLGCSLTAALASHLALQWIRGYNSGELLVHRERALRRHFRFEGAQRWFLPEIIAILPTLLHISILLFLGGILQWLIQINFTVSITIMISLAFSVAFYVLTQSVAAIWPSAPFRTPLSRFIETTFIFIHSQICAVYGKLQPKLVNPRKPKASTNMPGLSITSGTNTSLIRFREKKTIKSDVLLPSSALTWLLGHVELSGPSMPILQDIFEALISQELKSTMAQNDLLKKVAWPDIFEWLTQELSYTVLPGASYPPDIDDQFFTISQLSAIVGAGALQTGAQNVMRMNPFSFPAYQIGAQGAAVRFTLWKNEQPFLMDATGPPLKLLLDICQHHSYYSCGFLITCVREMTRLFKKGVILGIHVITCLTTLLNPRVDSPTTEKAMNHRTLRLEIISSAITAIEAINGNPVHAKRITDDKNIEDLLDLYLLYRTDGEVRPAEVQTFFLILAEQLVTLIADTYDHPTTLQILPILRHRAIRAIWGKHRTRLPADFLSSLLQGLDMKLQPLITSTDLTNSSFEATVAAVVLRIISILPEAPVPTTIEFTVLIEALTTLVLALQDDDILDEGKKNLIRFKGHTAEPQHEVTFSLEDPFPWFSWFVHSIGPSMAEPDFAFIGSLLLAAWSRYLFDTKLFCHFTQERMAILMQIEDKLLMFTSCLLMGWDFSEQIPDANAPEWEEMAWKFAVWHWASWPPYLLQDHDLKLLLTLSQCHGDFMERVVLYALESRTMRMSSAETIEMNPMDLTIESLISASIPAFMNMSASPYSVFSNILQQWSEHPAFKSSFLKAGGCEWLATRAQPLREAGLHLASRETYMAPPTKNLTPGNIYDPIQELMVGEMPIAILLDLFQGPTFETLSADECEHLLNSSIICDFPNDMDAQGDTLSIIKALRNRLTDLNESQTIVCPRAASVVAQALNQEILLANAGGYGINETLWQMESPFANIVGSLYEWIGDTKDILEDLRSNRACPGPMGSADSMKTTNERDFDMVEKKPLAF